MLEQGASKDDAERATDGPVPEELKAAAEGHNDFALALYGTVSPDAGNIFFSPLGVRASLSIACAGAAGETAAEMRRALRFASGGEHGHPPMAGIVQRLAANSGAGYQMAIANSLWIDQAGPLRAEFRDVARRYCGGDVHLTDFRCHAEAAASQINRYVEEKTGGAIRDVVSSSLGPDTALVLANGVYFKGKWLQKFPKDSTSHQPFYLEGGGHVRAPLMHVERKVPYLAADGFQVVELPYLGGELGMAVFLPAKASGLPDLERTLTARLFQECMSSMRNEEVKIFLPRFRLNQSMDLRLNLPPLGMRLAFSRSEADFSGINGHRPPDAESLSISAALHKAFVAVDEEGTEAAAATVMGIVYLSIVDEPPPVPIFRADHPFIFAIRERRSGMMLFLGRLTDPTSSKLVPDEQGAQPEGVRPHDDLPAAEPGLSARLDALIREFGKTTPEDPGAADV